MPQDHLNLSEHALADLDGHRRGLGYYVRLADYHREAESYDRNAALYHAGWQTIFAEEEAERARLRERSALSRAARSLACADRLLGLLEEVA